jgi:hypothetical protein
MNYKSYLDTLASQNANDMILASCSIMHKMSCYNPSCSIHVYNLNLKYSAKLQYQ